MAQRQSTPPIPIRGLNLDIEGTELPPEQITAAVNFIMRENSAERIGGYEDVLGTPLDAPRHLQTSLVGQQTYWIYFGDTIIGATDGTSQFDLTHASGIANAYDWSTTLINNLCVANNSTDDPMYWDGQTSNNFVTLPNWLSNTKTQAIRTFGTYLFALGIDDATGTRLNEVAWSDEAAQGDVPPTWVPASGNDAGNRELGETEGIIVDAARLRNSFIIYKDFSTYRCEFVGGNDVFGFELLYETSGCLSLNCVVEENNRHYVMTRDDIISHDGISEPISIADKQVRDYYRSNLNEAAANRAYAVNNIAKSEIWFCIPETGSDEPVTALVYNLQEQTWGIRSIAFPHIVAGLIAPPTSSFTYATISETYAATTLTYNENTAGAGVLNLLAADETNTKLVGVDEVENDRGAAIEGTIRREGLTFDAPRNNKLVTAVYPRIIGTAGEIIRIRVGYQNRPGDAVIWGSYKDFTIGTDDHVDADTLGPYIAIEFTNTSTAKWRLESYIVDYQLRGIHAL